MVPTIHFCKIRTICFLKPTSAEIIFGLVAIAIRSIYTLMFLLVNFSDTIKQRDLGKNGYNFYFSDPWIGRSLSELSPHLESYKIGSVVCEGIFRISAAVLLIVAAFQSSIILLRVWIKIMLVLMVFLMNDIIFIIINGILQKDPFLIVSPLIVIMVRLPIFLMMMALVDTHWRQLDEAERNSFDVKSVLNRALSVFNPAPRVQYPSIDALNRQHLGRVGGRYHSRTKSNSTSPSSPPKFSMFSPKHMFRGLTPPEKRKSVSTPERLLLTKRLSQSSSLGEAINPQSISSNSNESRGTRTASLSKGSDAAEKEPPPPETTDREP
ncbi:Hypothetical protein NTJ_05589 [Nesidiocoris tenuis]|uniref:Uncharacterized protein n=1 Tax=Nesidiocoris tenuis TaxID=355587 RepID=A0ABN7AMX8_9HEMI|nr:Hypothetical protein NTJ_05589 [Nesidiocoris tenuis]